MEPLVFQLVWLFQNASQKNQEYHQSREVKCVLLRQQTCLALYFNNTSDIKFIKQWCHVWCTETKVYYWMEVTTYVLILVTCFIFIFLFFLFFRGDHPTNTFEANSACLGEISSWSDNKILSYTSACWSTFARLTANTRIACLFVYIFCKSPVTVALKWKKKLEWNRSGHSVTCTQSHIEWSLIKQ